MCSEKQVGNVEQVTKNVGEVGDEWEERHMEVTGKKSLKVNILWVQGLFLIV